MTLPVTAVLVTFNSAAVIEGALASVPDGVLTIVVDNASSDNSSEIIAKCGAKVIRLDYNTGFGVANNAGIALSSTPYILLLNPDARLRPGALEALVDAAEAHPNAGLLVPTLIKADGSVFHKQSSAVCDPVFKKGADLPAGCRAISFASGAVVLARRDLLERIKGFDPNLFLYFEDDDLARRVQEAGYRILHMEAAVADHAGNTSSPPSAQMTYMKHWHLAWSERYTKRKFGMVTPGYWRVLESRVKMLWARLRRDHAEAAKQRGLVDGTLAHMRGVKAQDVRDKIAYEL
jgi:N-acetylglucosaminyl-diphospho-decaprenol L-rhamnosyltransferase